MATFTRGKGGLTLRLFGPFDACRDGIALSGLSEHRKVAQMLALLALYANRIISNEHVAEHLWPDTASIDSLGHIVPILRRALGPDGSRLTAKAGTLSLDLTGTDVDTLTFDLAWERRAEDPTMLEQVLDDYVLDAPLLQDWYEEWVETARKRKGYEEKYREALRHVAACAISRTDYGKARRYVRRLVDAGDASASLPSELLTALVHAGLSIEAKQFFEEYRDHLQQEHRVPPPRAMLDLYALIPRVDLDFVPEFASSLTDLEPVGGGIPLSSEFYVRRPADDHFHAAIARRDCIVLLKGPRQIGKTSLLARGLEQARQSGAQVIITDFQTLLPEAIETIEGFFLTVAQRIADDLNLSVSPEETWNSRLTASANFERYLKRAVFNSTTIPIVWGIDEADAVFDKDYRSGVFGLFRSWYNARALNPQGVWDRFTLILTYSTEAKLFIPNLNQSPFNVGTRIALQDFTADHVADLNARYACPLRDEREIALLLDLVGGQPFLVRRCLYEMRAHNIDIAAVEAEADREDGIFGDHLDRIRAAITKDAGLLLAVRGLLRGEPCPTQDSFSRLRAAGVLAGDALESARFRCRLYATYLKKHLI